MSHPRVNLLKKSERRYQGAVSRRFMLVSIVVTPILLIAVLSGIKLIQYGSIRSDLTASREIWSGLEPRLAVAVEQQRSLKLNREALELFNAWQDSMVPMEALLLDIQRAIPESIQLKRISIRSNVRSSRYRNADDLELNYRLVLNGIAKGPEAVDAASGLRRTLLDQPQLASMFDSMKLSSMRKQRGAEGVDIREFTYEGSSTAPEEEP